MSQARSSFVCEMPASYGTPKSRRSARDVPLLDRKLIADLKRLKMQHPHSGDPDALFWPGRTPGSHRVDYDRVWDVATFRRNYFKPALTRADLPAIRVHDLRHTAASLWLAAGFPPYQVSRWLGHASVVTTGHHLLAPLQDRLRAACRPVRGLRGGSVAAGLLGWPLLTCARRPVRRCA